MRLRTHVLTGIFISVATALYLYIDVRKVMVLGCLGALINILIDTVGHTHTHGRRSVVHSLFGVTLLVIVILLAYNLLIHSLAQAVEEVPVLGLEECLIVWFAGLMHLLLDSLTEGGVYFLWPFKKRRYALSHINYDDPLANFLAITFFLILMLYVAYLRKAFILDSINRFLSFLLPR